MEARLDKSLYEKCSYLFYLLSGVGCIAHREVFFGLKDIIDPERALVKMLPKMAGNAFDPGLKASIGEHAAV